MKSVYSIGDKTAKPSAAKQQKIVDLKRFAEIHALKHIYHSMCFVRRSENNAL